MIKKDYVIENCNIKKNKNIALFADTHFSNIVKIKKLEAIKQSLLNSRPDYICVPGDIIDSSNYLDKEENCDFVLNYFKDLQNIAPVLISLGSHDYLRIKKGKCYFDYNQDFFSRLNKLGNTHVLNNESITVDDIRFSGYFYNFYYYYNITGEEHAGILVSDFNEKMPKNENDKYNILLAHSPVRIFNSSVLRKTHFLNNSRLVLCGHMHGRIPTIKDKIICKYNGITLPNNSLLSNYNMGIINKNIDGNVMNMVITGGVTKIQETAPKLLHFAEEFYEPEIDYIQLLKRKN